MNSFLCERWYGFWIIFKPMMMIWILIISNRNVTRQMPRNLTDEKKVSKAIAPCQSEYLKSMCIYLHLHVHLHTHIYIYTYYIYDDIWRNLSYNGSLHDTKHVIPQRFWILCYLISAQINGKFLRQGDIRVRYAVLHTNEQARNKKHTKSAYLYHA